MKGIVRYKVGKIIWGLIVGEFEFEFYFVGNGEFGYFLDDK